MMDDEPNRTTKIALAMQEATKAFDNFFQDKYGEDPAFYTLDLKGYYLSVDFEPLGMVEIKDYSNGTRRNEDWGQK